jgi:hypothetical protein
MNKEVGGIRSIKHILGLSVCKISQRSFVVTLAV